MYMAQSYGRPLHKTISISHKFISESLQVKKTKMIIFEIHTITDVRCSARLALRGGTSSLFKRIQNLGFTDLGLC